MSANFTPGPWGYSFEIKNTGFEGDTFMAGPLHCDGSGGFSSVVEGGLVLADDNENEANARLIAAAPALYEALTALVSQYIERGPFDEPCGSSEQTPQINTALAALKLARGEEA